MKLDDFLTNDSNVKVEYENAQKQILLNQEIMRIITEGDADE